MRLVGLGAGGHSKVVIDLLRLMGGCEFVGLVDPKQQLWATEVLGIPVLGDDNLLAELYQQGVRHAFIGLGSVGDTQPRRRLYEKALQEGYQIVRAIHPRAIVSSSVKIDDGPTIMAGAIINAGAIMGKNVLVNTGAIVEHDCLISDHVHIATGARLTSTVHIDSGVHIGAGATVRQGVSIGEGSIVGAGSVVVKDIPPRTVVAGVPARVLKPSRPKSDRSTFTSQKAIS